jgi:phosphinothricin acetyltransferase
VNIRATVAEDLPQILAITNDEILHRTAHFGMIPVTPEQIQQEFAAAAGTHPWFTATDGTRVLGFAKAYPWKPRGAYRWTAEIGVYVVPGQQGKGIGLVVIHRAVAQLADSGDHRLLACVALAGDVALDGAHGHPLIGNPVVLAEGAELTQKTAIRMGGIDAGMTPDLLKHHLLKSQPTRSTARLAQLCKPAMKT